MPFSATRDLWLVLKARDEGTRAMRSFSRDIRMVGDNVKQANLQAARSALRNQMAMQRLTGASQNDIIATQKRIEQVDKDINSMRVARAAMEENRVSAQKLGTALNGAASTMTAVGTGLLIAGGLGLAGMKGLITSAIDYQKQSSLTRTQVDKFALSLKDVEDIGLRVANKVGVGFSQIQPALFDIFSSMEVGAADAEKLLTIFAKAAVAGQTDISSASRATIGILNAFQLPLTSINHLMDIQFQLVKEGIGTYEEWTQRIGLVSPSAVRFGQSVDMMAAALAASTRMGISAARSGTAVARAMDAMSNPTAVNNLKQLGVKATDATGKFRPMIDILRDFRKVLEKVPQADKIKTLLGVFKGAGGTIEARRFLQNMLLTPGNLELFQTIFETMSKESGSFEQAYAIMADTAATKSELLANKWETLKVKAGEALIPTFMKIVDAIGKVFDWFNKLDPKTQRMITLGIALGLALATLSGVLLIVLGSIAAFVAAVVTAGPVLLYVLGILTLLGLGFTGLVTAIVLAWRRSEDFRGTIKDLGKQFKDFYTNHVIPTAMAIRDGWEKYMKPALTALADIIVTRVLPVAREITNFFTSEFFKALVEVGNNVKDFVVFAFRKLGDIIQTYVIPTINALTKFYYEHKATIDQIVAALVWLGKWLLKIALILGGVLAVVLIGPVVAAFVAVGAAIAGVIIGITYLVEGIKWLVHWIGTEAPKAWNGLWDTVQSVISKISTAWMGIKDAFNGAKDWLVDAGKNIINGLIDGMKQQVGNIVGTVKDIAKRIRDYFPFSPAKTGPLSGRGSPFIAGQNIGKMLARGIGSKMDLVNGATNLIASASGVRAPNLNGVESTGRTYNQNIVVNTQELDPRRQAAELGWLLAGRSS